MSSALARHVSIRADHPSLVATAVLTSAAALSTKDVTKAINSFLPNSGLPLPDELTEVIDAYLEKHDEEGASERLQEDLLSIWEKSVKENVGSYAPWLAILRRLLPALRNPTYLVQWWDQMTEPVLDHMAQDKNLAKEAWANTLAVLTHDDGVDAAEGRGSNEIAIKLLKTWMQSFQFANNDGNSSGSLKATLTRGGLLSYGKKRPKGLLTALNSFIVQKEFRAQALTLLCEFVQSEPPHLHVVLETPLFDNILRSLQCDTSTTVVTLAITALTMLLPNVPSSLVPYLPKLFNIYARLLFWDRERSLAADNPEVDGDEEKNLLPEWEVCVFAPDADNMSIPNLLSYFTILYGLYPLNFVDYIRKPQRYLRHANMPNADDIEVQPSEIRQKSERFRQFHMLHPNFYNLTLESEKTDFSRWIKSESSEVVTECTALCLATELGVGAELGPAQELGLSEMDENARNGVDQPFLTGQAILARTSSRDLASAWRNSGAGSVSEEARTVAGLIRRASQSSHAPSLREAFQTRTRDGPGDSPTLPPSLVLSASHTNLQDMITSNKAIKTGLHQSLANDSVPSLALSHQESMHDKTSSKLSAPVAPVAAPPSTESDSEIQRLYKKILLLSNDLSFERYMKQQHMIHIGELKRRQLKEAATEAETQNLIMINRNLRNRIDEAKRSELRAKKESENRRNIAKKWETDLSAKLKLLREEQKKWSSEGAGLKRELEAKTEESEKLRRMVCEYETTELNSKQNLQAINDHVEEITRLKAEVSRLIEVEQTYQAKEKETEERLAEAAESIGRAEVLSMKLEARDAEVIEAKKLYESQISDLNTKLQEALQHGARRPRRENDPDKAIDGALAASRAKMADLQRRHNALVNKCTVLQASLLEKTSNSSRSPAFSSTPRIGVTSDSSDAELSAIVQSGDPPSPVRRRSRRGRGFSDPEHFVEGAQYNVTPPLDTVTGSSVGTVLHRPLTPTGSADMLSGGDRSPSDRFHGRGGVQNSGRKDKRDKKSSGIRGIRGFV